jgi:2'-5' RNA ligase
MTSGSHELYGFYDSLWRKAVGHFNDTGQVRIDAYLADKRGDCRLGLSVIGRPSPEAVGEFSTLLHELALVAPNQYFYRPDEFHITVLSLFTATEAFEPYFAQSPQYLAAVRHALSAARRFEVVFQGITASNSAVMVQGFPQSPELDQLRDQLRESLRDAGLGEGLDGRYHISTAHATVMRFQAQPRNLRKLVDTLVGYREYGFGRTTFRTLQLVKNDWYMSSDKVEVLAEYPLL